MSTVLDRSELGALDAVETAARVRAGELAAVEVIYAAVERARAASEELGAIQLEAYADALVRAQQNARGPFSGVPTFVKGLDDVGGQVNDRGSAAFEGKRARRTEPFVARLLGTGLVSLGRSAVPEIGLSATTEPLAHGPCRNPWDTDRSCGGSSGGAAALVAARVVPLAHASDAGGSTRIPASSCGLIGLKPSRGRGFGSREANRLPLRIFAYGAVTRSVRDTAAFFAALEAKRPARGLARVGLVEGPTNDRLRIGVFTDSPKGDPPEPEVHEATLAAATLCSSLGHHVEQLVCPYDARLLDDFWILLGGIAFATLTETRVLQGRRFDVERFEPWTRGLARHYRQHWRGSLGVLKRLRATRHVSARLYEKVDVVLTPTLAAPPPRLGEFAPDRPFEATLAAQQRHMPYTPIQNAAGDPALSLPMGSTRAGLPIGVQFAAVQGDEARLLALAYELEAAGAFRLLA